MAPLVLEGATLGKRHEHYNQLLNDAIATAIVKPSKIDYEKTDIENLFNIDIAISNKDVQYILDVLKGDDMLYASRVIKRCNWLINDVQYADIIDPEFLHSHLFPQMMAKASCKLLLQIRLTLKDESRSEKFFQYFKERDLKAALKWLPNCSLSVIEETVEKYSGEISPDLLRRLCERSSSVLEIFVKAHSGYKIDHLEETMFILRSDPEKYLDTLEKSERFYLPTFGKNHTKVVMKKCPHRFIDSFEKYMYNIDLDTFAKYLKKEDIKSFIIEQMKNKNVKSCLNHERISNFIKYMPKEDRYEFMKNFIDRKIEIEQNDCVPQMALKCEMMTSYCARGGGASSSSSYRWYKHAPFDVSFVELKKLIRTESNPDERNAMLMILVANARGNLKNILTLLQYYREKHMNEPFRFKVQFVNDLLHKTHPHLYNDQIWTILDEIFRSMEVYVVSENNVQTCIKSIIAYKVTRDEPVPDIIEQKFNFDSLKPYNKKMNTIQKEKLFHYLYNMLLNKLNNCKVSNSVEFAEYVELLNQGLCLLNDWKKELKNYPILITKINECVRLKKQHDWNTSLSSLYETKKSWKRSMFEDSLVLAPSHNACMNALKHDPELLARHKAAVEALCRDDAARMERVLGKLRLYWPRGAAREWAAAYRARLRQPAGHRALVRGLCSLLNRQEVLDFLKKYEPQESKINWADTDELQLSLRKTIAKNMHIARPQITPDTLMWYAKGDYVQFIQPSLNAVLYNLRPSHSRECVLNLLNGMTSLQKHGIRLAFAKLPSADIKQIFSDVWKSNKNASVRAVLFQNTHELLCKERNELLIADLWSLMQLFIDSLTAEENNIIYNTLGKLSKVHKSIKNAYCVKSYKFLKSLPAKADCKIVLQKLKGVIHDSIEQFDDDFIANIILEFVDDVLLKKSNGYEHRNDMNILISYLLCADNENIQLQRFENVLVPLMEKFIPLWNNVDDGCCYIRQNMQDIMEGLFRDTVEFAFKKGKVIPKVLFQKILAVFENSLPITQNFMFLRQLKLAIAFVDTIHKNKKSDAGTTKGDSEIKELYTIAITDFTNLVIQYIKEDNDLFGPTVYVSFAEVLSELLSTFNCDGSMLIKYVEKMLIGTDFFPVYLVTIQLLNNIYINDDQKEDAKRVHELLRSHKSPEVQILYFNKNGCRRCF